MQKITIPRQCGSCRAHALLDIRKANEHDFPALKKFLGKYLRENLTKEQCGDMLIALLYGDKIVACAGKRSVSPNTAYLGWCKVARPFRRQGIARLLLEKLIAEAKKEGKKIAYAVTLLEGPAKLVQGFAPEEITIRKMHGAVPVRWLTRFKKDENRFWKFNLT